MCSQGGCGLQLSWLWSGLTRPLGCSGVAALSPGAGGEGRLGLEAASSGEAGTGEEAGPAPTSSRLEDARVFFPCCSSKSVSPWTKGASWFLPSMGLAGVEGGAVGDLMLQKVRACYPTAPPQIYRWVNSGLSQAGPRPRSRSSSWQR